MPQSDAAPLRLRPVTDADVPIFFAHMQDADALHMAAFTPKDPTDEAAHVAHWQRIMAAETVVIRTVLVGETVAGHVLSFEQDGDWDVSYWLGREFWGQGLATRALAAFLTEFTHRPLYGRAAADNVASIRVMEKCGFRLVGREQGYANARGATIEEVVLRLD